MGKQALMPFRGVTNHEDITFHLIIGLFLKQIIVFILIFLSASIVYGEFGSGFHEIPANIKTIAFHPISKILKKSIKREKFDNMLQEFEVIESAQLPIGSKIESPIKLPGKDLIDKWINFLQNNYIEDKNIKEIIPKQAGWYITPKFNRIGLLSIIGLYKKDKKEYALFHSIIVFQLNSEGIPIKIIYSLKDKCNVLNFEFITNIDNDKDYEIVIKEIAYAGEDTIILDPSGASTDEFVIKTLEGNSWD